MQEELFYSQIDNMFSTILSEVKQNISGNYDFNKDIKIGEQGEDFIKNYLIKNFGFKFIKKKHTQDYDLLMEYNNREVTYEVKTDIYPEDTGNLVVEFECRKKPSGINVTKADYFVTYFPKFNEIWNIKSDTLKQLIKEHRFKKTSGSGDDKSETKLYLIPKEKYKEHFKVYKV